MMRRLISRWAGAGDPDPTTNNCAAGNACLLTTAALDRAYTAWYNRYSGTYTLYGPPMSFRLGFELNF